jgi:hypothetical protein
MSIRTTVTLDDDVAIRVKRESKARGASFRNTLNDLLREALLGIDARPRRTVRVASIHMGYRPELNHDHIESLLEDGEGDQHR